MAFSHVCAISFFVAGIFFVVFFFSSADAQEARRHITWPEVVKLASWTIDGSNIRNREQFCAQLPPEAKLLPHPSISGKLPPPALPQAELFEMHVILWSLEEACRTGVLNIEPDKELQCSYPIRLGRAWYAVELAVRYWSAEKYSVSLRCVEGLLRLYGVNLQEVEIEDSIIRLYTGQAVTIEGLSLVTSNPNLRPRGKESLSAVTIANSRIRNVNIERGRVGDVHVNDSTIRNLSLAASVNSLKLQQAKIEESLRIGGVSANDTRLKIGRIDVLNTEVGDISIHKAEFFVAGFEGLKARSLRADLVEGSIWIVESRFSESLSLFRSKFEGVSLARVRATDFEIADVKSNLIRISNSELDRVNLTKPASVGEITIRSSVFGSLSAVFDSVEQINCFACIVNGRIQVEGTVKEYLSLAQSRIADGVNLTGLRLSEKAFVSLANIQARYLSIIPQTFFGDLPASEYEPPQTTSGVLSLGGAKIDFITSGSDARGLLALPSEDLIRLIAPARSDGVFDPQPFTMLARMLTEAGYRDTASDLHVERIWRQLSGSEKVLNKIKGWIGYPIGYGYKPDPVLGLLVLMILIGAAMSWWMLSETRRNSLRGRRLPWYRAAWRHVRFVMADFFVSIVHLVPSLFGSWSATALPKTKGKRAKASKRLLLGESYFRFHTVLGSVLIFLLLTPATGTFD